MADQEKINKPQAVQDHNFIAIRRGNNPPGLDTLGENELGYAKGENGLYIGQAAVNDISQLPKKINITNLKDVEPTEANGQTVISDKNNSFKLSQDGKIGCSAFILVKGQGYGTITERDAIINPKEGQIFFQEVEG